MTTNYPKLSEGSISKLMNGEWVADPILQIIYYQKMISKDNNQIKYRLLLNDGISSGNNFIIILNLIETIIREELEQFSCIKLNNYTITPDIDTDKKVCILIQLLIVFCFHYLILTYVQSFR